MRRCTSLATPAGTRARQRGAALMIMMLIVVLGVAALLVRDLAARSAGQARVAHAAAALAQAKEALLGYALTSDATVTGAFGLLPCPDRDTSGGLAEGEAHQAACLTRYRSVLGRFPWKTLGVAPGRNAAGECLWYAVSGSHKHASAALPELLNTDSNGQFRVLAADGSTVLAGATPADRVVAVIIAPGAGLPGQVRTTLGAGVEQCAGNYTAGNYLDRHAASGSDNATLAAAADSVDDFIAADAAGTAVDDQLIFITRAELEERLMQRADVATRLRALTEAAAECVADYGRHNAAGPGDRRLPWPAPVDLAQYRADTDYDDALLGALSGRLPDRVNDSGAATGNSLARVLTDCDSAAVPEWTAAMRATWQHWKDHLFYVVAGSYRPDATPHSSCGTCLTVNGAGAHAAVVMFAGTRLPALGQLRDQPPADADTRGTIGNYLEGRNAANHPDGTGAGDYQSGAVTATFNDILYCIGPALDVTSC